MEKNSQNQILYVHANLVGHHPLIIISRLYTIVQRPRMRQSGFTTAPISAEQCLLKCARKLAIKAAARAAPPGHLTEKMMKHPNLCILLTYCRK